MNSLTQCRAALLNFLKNASPVPVKATGDSTMHPARLYAEININGPITKPKISQRFKLNILVIAIPRPEDNVYSYIDIANQFHDILQALALTVPNVGCLSHDGDINVLDFGYVDKAETIKQATITCDIILEN